MGGELKGRGKEGMRKEEKERRKKKMGVLGEEEKGREERKET